MKKIPYHIEIVRSNLIGQSSMSQASCDAILAVLSQQYQFVGITIIDCLEDLERLVDRQPDLVFLGMKFLSPERVGRDDPNKLWVSTYLEEHGIAYTGSARAAIEYDCSKPSAKAAVAAAGLATSAFFVTRACQFGLCDKLPLPFPLFLKPTNLGGGQGIDSGSVVQNSAQFLAKLQSLEKAYACQVLVERYLPGREFSVAILADVATGELAAMPIELVGTQDSKGHRILGQATKSANAETVLSLPAGPLRQEINNLATSVFTLLGGRDFGRIDVRLNAAGQPQFLEANLIPSLIAGYGSFPKAALLNRNLAHQTIILCIAKLGLVRSNQLPSIVLPLPTGLLAAR